MNSNQTPVDPYRDERPTDGAGHNTAGPQAIYPIAGAQDGRSRAALYTSIGAAALAVAGIVTALVVGLGSGGSAQANSGATPAPAHQASSQVPASNPIPAPAPAPAPAPVPAPSPNPVPPNTPPSASIRLLQQQLAQLHYYDGPITGYQNAQTIQAIQYLQRDAHLSQTGQLNPATQQALQYMLAHGNNQMAG